VDPVPIAATDVRHPTDDQRWRIVDTRLRKLGGGPDALIEVLHAVQEAFGYLDDPALAYVAESLEVPLSRVYGVATFYSYFTLKPQGLHTCVVCTGTACYIGGSSGLLDAVRDRLGVAPGATTEDRRVSLLTARCIGSCSLAPTATVDGELTGTLTPDRLVALLDALPGEEP
jgi:bidirectional [NiFe] hydrogenase diaphorase subunit